MTTIAKLLARTFVLFCLLSAALGRTSLQERSSPEERPTEEERVQLWKKKNQWPPVWQSESEGAQVCQQLEAELQSRQSIIVTEIIFKLSLAIYPFYRHQKTLCRERSRNYEYRGRKRKMGELAAIYSVKISTEIY